MEINVDVLIILDHVTVMALVILVLTRYHPGMTALIVANLAVLLAFFIFTHFWV